MKKWLSIGLCLAMLLPALISCTDNSGATDSDTEKSGGSSGLTQTADAYRVGSLKIAGNEIASYVIVRPETADACVKHAAEELQDYIEKATGIRLEIAGEKGSYAHKIDLVEDETGNHGEEDFTIAVENGDLTITGGTRRGVLYGVYEFLEAYVGWRFVLDGVEYLYEAKSIDIPEGTKDTQRAVFEERYTSFYPNSTGGKSDLNVVVSRKMNGGTAGGYSYSAAQGGGHGRTFINSHSFIYQMPDACVGENDAATQPCLSSEKNYEDCMAWIINLIEERRALGQEVMQIAVGQNDSNIWCHCEDCTKAKAEEGGTNAGPLIRFVNRCADALRSNEKYKDIMIYTLAYGGDVGTSEPPKVTKPAENVIVCFCADGACNNHTLNDASCEMNAAFTRRLDEWLTICDNVYTWYYTINFPFAYSILANFDCLLEDARYFAEKGVKGIYFEGANDTTGRYAAMMWDLRAYLTTHVMWDPYMSDEKYEGLIDEFFMIMYGGGYSELHEYLDIMTEAANRAKPSHYLGNLYSPVQTTLYAHIARNYEHIEELFDGAEQLTETEEQKERLELLRGGFRFLGLTAIHDTWYEWGNTQVRAEYTERYRELWTYLHENSINIGMGILVPDTCDPSVPPVEWYSSCPFIVF